MPIFLDMSTLYTLPILEEETKTINQNLPIPLTEKCHALKENNIFDWHLICRMKKVKKSHAQRNGYIKTLHSLPGKHVR